MKKLDIFPGKKTYGAVANLVGMLACQGFGFHTFTQEVWGAAVVAVFTFWKMGQDRNAGKL